MDDEYSEEERLKLINLRNAIAELDGVAIPFNITCRNIQPLYEWVKGEVGE